MKITSVVAVVAGIAAAKLPVAALTDGTRLAGHGIEYVASSVRAVGSYADRKVAEERIANADANANATATALAPTLENNSASVVAALNVNTATLRTLNTDVASSVSELGKDVHIALAGVQYKLVPVEPVAMRTTPSGRYSR